MMLDPPCGTSGTRFVGGAGGEGMGPLSQEGRLGAEEARETPARNPFRWSIEGIRTES